MATCVLHSIAIFCFLVRWSILILRSLLISLGFFEIRLQLCCSFVCSLFAYCYHLWCCRCNKTYLLSECKIAAATILGFGYQMYLGIVEVLLFGLTICPTHWVKIGLKKMRERHQFFEIWDGHVEFWPPRVFRCHRWVDNPSRNIHNKFGGVWWTFLITPLLLINSRWLQKPFWKVHFRFGRHVENLIPSPEVPISVCCSASIYMGTIGSWALMKMCKCQLFRLRELNVPIIFTDKGFLQIRAKLFSTDKGFYTYRPHTFYRQGLFYR